MKVAKIIAAVYAVSLCSTSAFAQYNDGDVWSKDRCMQVAQRCIAQFGSGTREASECWTQAVGDHCPDGGSDADYPSPFPDCWAGPSACHWEPMPF
jgi:hypothetical protein